MNGEKAIALTTFVSLSVIVLAYYFSIHGKFNTDNELQTRLSYILDAMLQIEQKHKVGDIKIAIGYGACKDLFVKGQYIFGKETPNIQKHHHKITSWEELKQIYALFFNAGSAAERFISNETLFRSLVSNAEREPSSYFALGGNAPVMAKRFALEGIPVMLAAKRTKVLMDSMLPNIVVAGGESDEYEEEDIHLIFEYYKDEKWGSFSAQRSNRFIIHKDSSNPTISSAAFFGKQMKMFKPNLFVVGGLQMMDNYPYKSGEREKYLEEVSVQMVSQPSSTLVHFEMASFTDINLLQDLKKLILPFADSLGMNEQHENK